MDQEENSEVRRSPKAARSSAPWKFRLYVNGKNSLKSIITQQNLNEFCEKFLPGRCDVEVIDMAENFEMARADRIMALPTLVRREPLPMCKIIGDLSNTNQVVTALGLHGSDAGD